MLSQLVEELFELSKLDAKQIKPQLEIFSLSELVQDVVLKYRPHADEAEIQLESAMPAEALNIKADIGLIERALSNLIENAIKYTPEKGVVKVALTDADQAVRFVVSDTGAGIAEEDLPHVFDRYYRGKQNATRKPGGTGLGLAISKKILQLHQSDIEVESQLNVGTRFMFTLQRDLA